MGRLPGHNPNTLRTLHTSHLKKIAAWCPPDDLCCDTIPDQINAVVWIEEGSSGGEIPINCEEITLIKDVSPQPDGSFSWRGNLTAGNWTDCINPGNAEVVFNCNNAQQIPGTDDCTTAFLVTVEDRQVTRDEGCCCNPVCFSGGMALQACPSTLPCVEDPGTCGIIDTSAVNMRVWIWEEQTFENVITSDTFNRPDEDIDGTFTDALLGGAPMQWEYGGGAGNLTIEMSKITSDNKFADLHAVSKLAIAQSDIRASCVAWPSSDNTHDSGLIIRYSGAAAFWKIALFNDRFEIIKENAGETVVATQAGTFPDGTPHTIQVVADGANIIANVDGNANISNGGDNFNQGATDHGAFCGSGYVSVDNVKYWAEVTGVGCLPTPLPPVSICQDYSGLTLVECMELSKRVIEFGDPPPAEVKAQANNFTINAAQVVQLAFEEALVTPKAFAVDLHVAGETSTFSVDEATVTPKAFSTDINVASVNCRDNIPEFINARVWIEYEPPGGPPGAQCRKDANVTLQREGPTSTIWSGTTNFLDFIGCVVPSEFTVKLIAQPTGTDCTTVLSARIRNIAVTRHDCACTANGAAFSSVQRSLGSLGFTIFQGGTPNTCQLVPGDEAIAQMGVYITGGANCNYPANPCF